MLLYSSQKKKKSRIVVKVDSKEKAFLCRSAGFPPGGIPYDRKCMLRAAWDKTSNTQGQVYTVQQKFDTGTFKEKIENNDLRTNHAHRYKLQILMRIV